MEGPGPGRRRSMAYNSLIKLDFIRFDGVWFPDVGIPKGKPLTNVPGGRNRRLNQLIGQGGIPTPASSTAAPTRRIRASSKAGPMICNPAGRPELLRPQGIDRAGRPRTLIARTSRVVTSRTSSSRLPIRTVRLPIRGAVLGVVGVKRQSTCDQIRLK